MTRRSARAAVAGALAIALAGVLGACSEGSNEPQAATSSQTQPTPSADAVIVDGSSTVFPIMKEAAKRFENEGGGAEVSVQFSGSTAGFEKFCAGELDIANASRAMNAEEEQACSEAGVTYRRLPIAGDAIAVVAHKSNRIVDALTTDELRALWEEGSDVNTWADLRAGLPNEPIHLYGRGQNSGTYDYFTEALTGEARNSRSDYEASEDEEYLAEEIANDPAAIGFFGLGAYHRHWDELKLLAVDSGGGPVYPSLETARDGSYAPLSRPLYLYVSEKSLAEKPAVQPFLSSTYGSLERWLHFTGYLPLPAGTYEEVRQSLN